MTFAANECFNAKLSHHSEKISSWANPMDFYKLVLCIIEFISCFVWISMPEGRNFIDLPGLWILPCMTSQGFSTFSALPDRLRDVADGQQSWKDFTHSAAVISADHRGWAKCSGSVLWALAAGTCCREGLPEKAEMHQLFYFLCVCGVIPMLSMIIFQK